jgi:hypothetical protein
MLLLGSSNTHLQAKLSYHYSIYVLSVRLIEALTSPFFSRIGPVQECISAEYERIHVLARNHACTWRWRRAHARPSCIKLSGTSEQNESGRIRQLKFHCVSPSLSVCSSLFFTGKIETLLLGEVFLVPGSDELFFVNRSCCATKPDICQIQRPEVGGTVVYA